jgi:hypothetical protein
MSFIKHFQKENTMQYESIVLVVTPLLFGVLNMIRGSANPVPYFKGKVFNAILYAATIALLFYSTIPLQALLVLGLLSIPAMLGAMSFGWGEYVGAQLEARPPTDAEVPFIDTVIHPFEDNPRLWGFLGNTLRGVLGGVILAVPFLLVGLVLPAALVCLGSSLMGLAFGIAPLFPRSWDQWKVGEAFMGAFIGLGVAIASILRKKK